MRQGYHLIRWSDGGMNYWAISDVNEQRAERFRGIDREGLSRDAHTHFV